MRVLTSSQKFSAVKTNLLVIPLSEEDVQHKTHGQKVNAVLGKDFKGELKQTVPLYNYSSSVKTVLLVGLGKEKDITAEIVRKAYSHVIKTAKAMKINSFTCCLPKLKISEADVAFYATEGLVLGGYFFGKYKTEDKARRIDMKNVTLLTSKGAAQVKKAQAISENTCRLRDVIHESTYNMTTVQIADLAKKIAREKKLKVTVFDEKKLKQMGMNLIIGVGGGSKYPPRLVILEYRGNPKSKDRYAILGKGITFDSGGMNLKPTGYMETMKMDKTGAMCVLYTMKTLAEVKPKVNVVGFMPLCENMIGPGAQKPGDYVMSYSGKGVEIGNTDAEGRLILGDTLAYCEKVYKPKFMINLATLTGAVIVALGNLVAGVWSNDEKLVKKIEAAGERTFERVWHMPLHEEYFADIKSEIADIKNIGAGKGNAGSITAAAFLKSFVDKTPWAHLDIAGTAWEEKPRDYIPKGPTGYGVRLLVDLFENL